MTDRASQQARHPEPGNEFIYETSQSPRQEKFESLQDMQMQIFAVQAGNKHIPKLDEHGLQKWKLRMGQSDPLVGEQHFTLSTEFRVEAGYTLYSLIYDLYDMDAPGVFLNFDTLEHIEKEDVVPESRYSLPAAIEKFSRSAEILSNAYQQYLCLITGAQTYFFTHSQSTDEADKACADAFAELHLDAVEWGESQIQRQSLISGKAGFGVMMSHELRRLKKTFYETLDEYAEEDLDDSGNQLLNELEQRFKAFTDNIETYFHVLDVLAAERRALLESTAPIESSRRAFGEMLLDITEMLHDESFENDKTSPDLRLCFSLFEIRNAVFMTAANAFLQQSTGIDATVKARSNSLKEYFSYEFSALSHYGDYSADKIRSALVAVREYFEGKIAQTTNLLESATKSD